MRAVRRVGRHGSRCWASRVAAEGLGRGVRDRRTAALGAAASILLAATTEVPRLLGGLDRLRVPAGAHPDRDASWFATSRWSPANSARMRTAMVARGHDPRWLWQARPIAAAPGALFVRSYERGERVHAAMLARGYTGAMPELARSRPSALGAAGRRRSPRPCGPWRCSRRGTRAAGPATPRAGARSPRSAGVRASASPTRTVPTALRGFDLTVAPGERVAVLGSERRRQDHVRAALQRPAARPARAGRRRRRRAHRPLAARRSAAGSGSCSRTPTTSCSSARCARTSRSARRTSACAATRCDERVTDALARGRGRPPRRPGAAPPLRRGTSPVSRWPPSSRCSPDLLVLDEPTSNLDPAGTPRTARRAGRLPVTQLVVTHDLPFALELCPRAVIVNGGRVVADGPTARPARRRGRCSHANRLELPFGFDPRTATPRG